jgi:hypothetical protein
MGWGSIGCGGGVRGGTAVGRIGVGVTVNRIGAGVADTPHPTENDNQYHTQYRLQQFRVAHFVLFVFPFLESRGTTHLRLKGSYAAPAADNNSTTAAL